MASKLEGLTLSIGADTTALNTALSGVNKSAKNLQSELRDVEKLLKLDPTNTELLAQKEELLAKSVETAKEKLDTLKTAAEQAQDKLANGEIGEDQFRALQREIVKTEQSIKGFNDRQDEMQTELSQTSKDMKSAADSTDDFKNSVDTVGGLTKTFAAGVGGIAAAAVGAAESTREYREDMAKLETAFSTAGFSAEQAKGVYDDFYAVLGESDRSVEAVNHLAKLTKTQEELDNWTTIATGVWATFGDSLPIEGLTEAANETAKVGQVTGPLADALNWAGVSEDEFNEKLADATTEQERQALITETLNGLYSDAAEKYREVNGEVLAANEAQSQLNDTIAEIGAEVEPIITEVKEKLAEFMKLILDNKEAIITAVAGIGAALLTLNVAIIIQDVSRALKNMETTTTLVTGAQKALNTVMKMNPWVLIATLISGVVVALITLWNTNEDFRNAVIGICTNIKDTISGVVDAIKTFFTVDIPNTFTNMKNKVSEIISGIITFIKENWQTLTLIFINPIAGAVKLLYDLNPKFKAWVDDLITNFKNWILGFRDIGKNILEGIWNGISDKVGWLKNQVSGVVDKIKGWFTGKDGFDTHSPSKWSEKIAGFVTEGLGIGFNDNLSSALNSAKNVTSQIKNVMNEGLINQLSSSLPYDFGSTVQYATSTRSDYDNAQLAEGIVNGLAAVMSANSASDSGGTYTINLVLDSRTLAQLLFDPLRQVSKQRGVSLG